MISSISSSVLHLQPSDSLRPHSDGDESNENCAAQGFMDYTDDSCMDFVATRNRQRAIDGTSNTLQIG